MPAETAREDAIRELEQKLARRVDGHPPLTLTPAWWQQRLLDWATSDPAFRAKLLRFVDVLPTLRSARAIADHVRQYFRPDRGHVPGVVQTAAGLAAQPVFRPVLSQAVRRGVFAMAHRFIAGSTPEAAVPALRDLAREGVAYTVDLLGEATLSDAEADAYLARYTELLETLAAHTEDLSPHGERHDGGPGPQPRHSLWAGIPPVNISVKLSALCPHMEAAAPERVSAETRERLRPLLRLARERGAFINFDMEQHRYKDLVHRTFEDLLSEPEFADFADVGIVVQAYLRDAEDDLARLRAFAERRDAPFSVRLVKGAYWDEEVIVADQNSWPVPVYEEKAETDACFERCTDTLLAAWPRLRLAFGTHNPRSAAQAVVKARAAGVPDAGVEFQVLYGMAEGLRTAIAGDGYRTRVYLPIGEVIPGMAYLVRRLLENTSNQAWFNVGVTAPAASRSGVPSGLHGGAARGLPTSPAPPSVAPPPVGQGPSPDHVSSPDHASFRNAPPARFFEPETRARMHAALDAVRKAFGASYPLVIGARRVTDRPHADIVYPAEPETVTGRVAQATVADVEDVVAIARSAFPAWRDLPARKRGDILRRAADIIDERRFELAATMVFESAKPWHEADGDVTEAVDYLRYYPLQAERLSAPVPLPESDPGPDRPRGGVLGERNDYFHEGRGVAAIIAPWNFPLAIITGMAAAALAAGNAAILKPAAQSPVIAYKLVEILREAGVPPDVVHYLPGRGSEIGRALVEHPGVDTIAFTGSNAVGLGIIEAAARTSSPAHASVIPTPVGQGPSPDHARNVKRVIAEMGGKNAIIIDDDADLDQAVWGAVVSAFGYAGQKCSACSRLIIVGSAYEPALERFRNAVESLVVGPPHDPATFVPPVIGASARDKIMAYIDAGRRDATLLVQGRVPLSTVHYPLSTAPFYVPPAVFTGVPLDSPLARDEIFGPVLAVFRARDFDEALDIAMRSDFALTGGVFSRNPRHIELARRRFRVGNLYINRKITGAIAGRQPFGGLLMSGAGEKAGGPDYVRQFMEPRVVTENTMRRGFAPEEWG